MTDRAMSLAALRVNAQMRQKVAAERIGVTVQTLQNWECGKTTPNLLFSKKLADLYNVDLNTILFGLKIRLE